MFGTRWNRSRRKGTFAILTCVYLMWAANSVVLQFYTLRLLSGSRLNWAAFRSEHESSPTAVCCKQKRRNARVPRPGTRMRCGRSLPQVRHAFLTRSNCAPFWVKVNSFNFARVIQEGQQLLLTLTAQGTVVTAYRTCVSIQKLCVHFCVSRKSHNKQRLFSLRR